jgi:hypothetical protein
MNGRKIITGQSRDRLTLSMQDLVKDLSLLRKGGTVPSGSARSDTYFDTLLSCLDDGNALLEGPASAVEPADGDRPRSQTPKPGGDSRFASLLKKVGLDT